MGTYDSDLSVTIQTERIDDHVSDLRIIPDIREAHDYVHRLV
jgi:hypothetical protein